MISSDVLFAISFCGVAEFEKRPEAEASSRERPGEYAGGVYAETELAAVASERGWREATGAVDVKYGLSMLRKSLGLKLLIIERRTLFSISALTTDIKDETSIAISRSAS